MRGSGLPGKVHVGVPSATPALDAAIVARGDALMALASIDPRAFADMNSRTMASANTGVETVAEIEALTAEIHAAIRKASN